MQHKKLIFQIFSFVYVFYFQKGFSLSLPLENKMAHYIVEIEWLNISVLVFLLIEFAIVNILNLLFLLLFAFFLLLLSFLLLTVAVGLCGMFWLALVVQVQRLSILEGSCSVFLLLLVFQLLF